MYILNTSFMVDPKAHDLWYKFVVEKFMPRLKQENLGNIFFSRVLSQQKEDHYTYSIQIHIPTLDEYKRYTENIFEDYLQISIPMFSNSVAYFTTVMKLID